MSRPAGLTPEREAWINTHALVSGSIAEPRDLPWSVVLRVPTPEGDLWFKENVRSLAHEAALVEILSERAAILVPELVAVERASGRFLMRDAGSRLRERPPTEDDWLSLLPRYAELQVAVAGDVQRAVELGVPDRRLRGLPAQFRALLVERSAQLERSDALQLERYADRLDESCAALRAGAVPESIQHDDFHDGNIFVRDGAYRFIDWGDACVTHPFATMRIPLEGIAEDTNWDLDRLRDAYLEPFSVFAGDDELRRLFGAGIVVAGATRALKWDALVRDLARPNAYEETLLRALRALLDN